METSLSHDSFDFRLYDAKHKFDNFQGDRFYTSEVLVNCWRKGYVVASPMNFQTALYTARYTNKKVYGSLADEVYHKHLLEPPSVRMSRMPGIGFPWFELNSDKVFTEGQIILPDGREYFPPSAFIKKYLDSHDYQTRLQWYRNKAKFVEGLENNLLNTLKKQHLSKEEYF